MVSIFVRDCLRLGFKERLKRMDSERVWMLIEEDLERFMRLKIASRFSESKFLF